MNILNFAPKLNREGNISNNSTVITSNLKGLKNASYPNLKPLNHDTVSFSGKEKILKEAIANDYNSQIPHLKAMGLRLMDTLSGVCSEVAGTIYDVEYCKKALTKSLDRYLEKLKDSGSTPMDKVRSTVFIQNIYDFSIISKFIEKMKERDFLILPVPAKTSGKKVLSWQPDFDIRLDKKKISPESIKALPEDLRGCISHKQKSGYGDIQVRFVDASSIPPDKRTPQTLSKLTPQEVIFVYGKATADAKSKESQYIYNITRALDKMHIAQTEKSISRYTPQERVKNNIECIGNVLRNELSNPMYENAERIDVYRLDPILPEELRPASCTALKNLMKEIETETEKFYNGQYSQIISDDFTPKIIEMIKASPEYKAAKIKTITPNDIKSKRNELLYELQINWNEDIEKIEQQAQALKETIKEYKAKPQAKSKEKTIPQAVDILDFG